MMLVYMDTEMCHIGHAPGQADLGGREGSCPGADSGERARALETAGVPGVWLDPGFEFAKSLDDNLRLLLGLPDLATLGYPVLVSASRKGFLGEILGAGPRRSSEVQALPGIQEATVAVNALAGFLGAQVVRVHDVAAVRAALRVSDHVRRVAAG